MRPLCPARHWFNTRTGGVAKAGEGLKKRARNKRALRGSWRRPTLPQRNPCSTIGPGGLNDRVRDGIGCNPSGKTTKKEGGESARSMCYLRSEVPSADAPDLGL